MPILRIIIDICLLRGRPQDLPVSWNLFWLWVSGSVVISYASSAYVLGSLPQPPASAASASGPGIAGLLLIVLGEAIFGGVVWVLLKTRNHPERWLQSMTALYAVGALFALAMLPAQIQGSEVFARALEAMQQGAPMPDMGAMSIKPLLLFVFVIAVWHLLAMAQVLHHAMESSFALAVLISILTLLTVFILQIMLLSILSVLVSV